MYNDSDLHFFRELFKIVHLNLFSFLFGFLPTNKNRGNELLLRYRYEKITEMATSNAIRLYQLFIRNIRKFHIWTVSYLNIVDTAEEVSNKNLKYMIN